MTSTPPPPPPPIPADDDRGGHPAGPMLAPPLPSAASTWAQWLGRSARWRHSAGLIASFAAHCVALLLLSLAIISRPGASAPLAIDSGVSDVEELLEEELLVLPSISERATAALEVDEVLQQALAPEAPDVSSPWAQPKDAGAAPRAMLHAAESIPDLLTEAPMAATGGGFEGRAQTAKATLLAERGGTPQSEAAVDLALQWLAAHQRNDGGWRLNHQQGPCAGRCRHPGSMGTSTGATGLALLPFLGAGHHSQGGEYRDVVRRGVYYLQGRLLETPHGGDLQEGTMYAQGIAAIAFCENYALSGDPALREPAQQAIDFICHAQHPKGGWRYFPGQPGDTTVTGWQVMALKSAKLAGLRVPSPVIEQAKAYLNGVQSSDGAFYGYFKPGKEPAPTAVGLLLRMYTGWPQDDTRLNQGVDYLAARGPSDTDVYFNYYATQVLHHHEGPQWKPWNDRLRERLIGKQSKDGHERGSWYFLDKHNEAGGRLYTTAMCAMILEVYYRHMPLYEKRSVQDF